MFLSSDATAKKKMKRNSLREKFHLQLLISSWKKKRSQREDERKREKNVHKTQIKESNERNKKINWKEMRKLQKKTKEKVEGRKMQQTNLELFFVLVFFFSLRKKNLRNEYTINLFVV